MSRGPEINRVAGQPPIDTKLGGKPVPELHPAPRGGSHRRISGRVLFAGGVLAAGIGAAAVYGASGGFSGSSDSEPTPGPSAITSTSSPEASPTPSATISAPSESPVVTITPSPTPEVTPTPIPEATPATFELLSIFDSKPTDISKSKVEAALRTASKSNPSLQDKDSLKFMLSKFGECSDSSLRRVDIKTACRGLMAFISLDKSDPHSMDKASYIATRDVWYYANKVLANEYTNDYEAWFKELIGA